MVKNTLHQPGDILHKALEEFSVQVADHPDFPREEILQKIAMQFDLSPKDYEFLRRHCLEDNTGIQP